MSHFTFMLQRQISCRNEISRRSVNHQSLTDVIMQSTDGNVWYLHQMWSPSRDWLVALGGTHCNSHGLDIIYYKLHF